MTEFQQLQIRNWSEFQHYKDRDPPWIKLHFKIMSSEDWVQLEDGLKAAMIVCMLVASRNFGKLPNNPDYIKRVGYLKRRPNLNALIKSGFLEIVLADASKVAQALADARPETETYRKEKESPLPPSGESVKGQVFDSWYATYPHKVGKGQAKKAFPRALAKAGSAQVLIDGVARYIASKPNDCPWCNPSTWLNGERWLDHPADLGSRVIAYNFGQAAL